jgi:hypothetical protein
MATAVAELDNTVSDDIIDLKKRLRLAEHRQAEDKIRIRQLETTMKQMEDFYLNHARVQDARMDTLAAQLSSIRDKLESAKQQQQQHPGNKGGKRPPAGDPDAYQRIDTVIKPLTEQVERVGTLQVHETKVACHCTHTMLNDNIKKLGKRMGQIWGILAVAPGGNANTDMGQIERGLARVRRKLGLGRAATEGRKDQETDEDTAVQE